MSGSSSVHTCPVSFFWSSSLCHRDSPIMCFGWQFLFTLFHCEKVRDMWMNTSNKEWLQALKLRAIGFLVVWSLSQSNSHNKGNIKLRTCRAVQVCTIVLYCSFGSLACATEILPSCVLESNLSLPSFSFSKYETCYWTLRTKNDFKLSHYARLLVPPRWATCCLSFIWKKYETL